MAADIAAVQPAAAGRVSRPAPGGAVGDVAGGDDAGEGRPP